MDFKTFISMALFISLPFLYQCDELPDPLFKTKLIIEDRGPFHSCGGQRVFAEICKFDKGKSTNRECCEDNIVPSGSFASGETIVAELDNCNKKFEFSADKNDLYFTLRSENDDLFCPGNFEIETQSGQKFITPKGGLIGDSLKTTGLKKLEFLSNPTVHVSDPFIRTTLTIWDGGIFHTCGGHNVHVQICKTAKGDKSNKYCCEDNIVPNGNFASGEIITADLNTCKKFDFSEDENDLYFKLESGDDEKFCPINFEIETLSGKKFIPPTDFLTGNRLKATKEAKLQKICTYTVDPNKLRVMVFNIWGMPGTLGGVKDKTIRMKGLADMIRTCQQNFDILILTELWMKHDHQIINEAAIEAGLNMTGLKDFSGGCKISPAGCSGLAVIYNPKLNELGELGEFDVQFKKYEDKAWTSHIEDFSSKGIGKVHFKLPNGLTLNVFLTHTMADAFNYINKIGHGIKNILLPSPPLLVDDIIRADLVDSGLLPQSPCVKYNLVTNTPTQDNQCIRKLQFKKLMDLINESNADLVILGGDLNENPPEKLIRNDTLFKTNLTIWGGGIFHSCGGKRVFAQICKTAKGKNSTEECCEDNIVPNGSFASGETNITASLNNCSNLAFSEDKNDLYFKLKSENDDLFCPMDFDIETVSGRKLITANKNLNGRPVKETEFRKLEFAPGGYDYWELLYKSMNYAGSSYINDENYATYGNPQNTYTKDKETWTLDYIFYKSNNNEASIELEEFSVPWITTKKSNGDLITLSDHEPILATFQTKRVPK